jgi:hypothetical protein
VNQPSRSEETEPMTDIFKPIADDHETVPPEAPNEAGRTLLVGVVGGILSAAGYLVYSRLPEEQRDKLRAQVRLAVDTRVNELRSRFNL